MMEKYADNLEELVYGENRTADRREEENRCTFGKDAAQVCLCFCNVLPSHAMRYGGAKKVISPTTKGSKSHVIDSCDSRYISSCLIIIAELRRPEAPPSRAPYSIKE